MNPLLLAFLFVVVLATGCSRNSGEFLPKTNSHATKIYTKADLDKLIVSGMSLNEVTNVFGPPASAIQVKENVVILTFLFPFEITSREKGLHLTGFDVHTKDGKVVDWSPITGGSLNTIQAGGTPGSFGEQPFDLFIVTDELTNALKTFESGGVANISSLKSSPDLAFKAKVFAGNSDSGRPGEQSVILVLGNEDASKLKDLSENNFGKRLLIVCRNKVLAAPAISAPIASNKLLFTVKNSSVLDSLRNQ